MGRTELNGPVIILEKGEWVIARVTEISGDFITCCIGESKRVRRLRKKLCRTELTIDLNSRVGFKQGKSDKVSLVTGAVIDSKGQRHVYVKGHKERIALTELTTIDSMSTFSEFSIAFAPTLLKKTTTEAPSTRATEYFVHSAWGSSGSGQ